MTRTFFEFLEATGPTEYPTTTSVNMPTTPDRDLSYAMSDPRTTHLNDSNWAYGMFRRWYSYHRGNWKEVEAAAQQRPEVVTILRQIEQTMKKSGLGRPGTPEQEDGSFDIEQPTLMGRFGDMLQKAVAEVIPNHGYRQWSPPAIKGSSPTGNPTGNNPAEPSYNGDTKMNQQGSLLKLTAMMQQLIDRVNRIEQKLGAQ
jgi:hypothetical protein